MLTIDQARLLIAGLRRHILLAEHLHKLLGDEFAAIKTGNAAVIEAAANAKLEPLTQLNRNESLRQQFFARVAPDLDAANLAGMIERIPVDEQANYRAALAVVSKALRSCAQQNQINGATIGLIRRFTEDLIAHIQGEPALPTTASIYGRDGQNAPNVTTHGVVRA